MDDRLGVTTLVEAAEAEDENREISEISRMDKLSVRGNVRAEAKIPVAGAYAEAVGRIAALLSARDIYLHGRKVSVKEQRYWNRIREIIDSVGQVEAGV
jgi:hypothetical protein